MKDTWTHAELVERAGRWLRYSASTELDTFNNEPRRKPCSIVLMEPSGCWTEIPDAIGWNNCGNTSILIECKRLRPDYLSDKTKPHRLHENAGMGQYRYYMAPPDIITLDDLEGSKWGLLVCVGRSVEILKLPEECEYHDGNEKDVVMSALRAAQTRQRQANK